MKKLALIAAMVAAVGTASATEVTVQGGRNVGTNADFVGVTVTQPFAGVNVGLSADQSTVRDVSVRRYSLTGAKDLTKVAGVILSAKAGVAAVDPARGADGFAALVGVGATYPVAKGLALVADYSYQRGQERVSQYNGNLFSVGVKFSF